MIRRTANRIALAVAVCLGTPLAAPAQSSSTGWFNAYRTFSVYLENDALAKWRSETTDQSFTQGLRMVWEFSVWPKWAMHTHRRLSLLTLVRPAKFKPVEIDCTPAATRAAGPCGLVSFGLGQTIYSPVDIGDPNRQLNDQPFAGWLFGTMGLHARHGRWQSASEFVVGVTGPPSIARNTQSLAHWTWAQGAQKPAGWNHQLRGAIHAGLMQTYAVHAVEFCRRGHSSCSGGINEGRIFDLSPRVEFVGTSAMLRASGGAMVRLGYGFPDALGQRIPATASPRAGMIKGRNPQKWWVAGFAGADWRKVGYNAFLHGGYADGGADGWRSQRQIDPRGTVDERSAGVSFGNSAFTVSAQAVSRSLEWDARVLTGARGRLRHSYLAVVVGLNTGR